MIPPDLFAVKKNKRAGYFRPDRLGVPPIRRKLLPLRDGDAFTKWLRELDSNQRLLAYEASTLPLRHPASEFNFAPQIKLLTLKP
jgi:hypothetical protein